MSIKVKEKNILDNIKLSFEQSKIFNILENTSKNLYITGKAGTGKSLLLQYFVNNTKKKVIVLAPTGVAALNVEGQTIHSFFCFTPDIQFPKIHEETKVFYKTKIILEKIDTIIIDEVSMVSVDIMESINVKCQKARGNTLPFGGLQLILFGDLYQLPPVISDPEIDRYLNDTYGGIFFFNASVFKKSKLEIYELENIHRQNDKKFKDILNRIRTGDNANDTINSINACINKTIPKDGFITLAGRNEAVNKINKEKLGQIESREYIYIADINGDIKESIFPTEKELHLKIGAQIMMLTNDPIKRWVNGTVGVITALNEDTVRVKINDVEHAVNRYTWDKYKYYYDPIKKELEKEIISSFTQFPIRLAWAVTIHKSQGKTYESVLIDLTDGAFDAGQTYVAISRCVSLDTLYLKEKIKSKDIIINQEIVEFMKQATIIKIEEI